MAEAVTEVAYDTNNMTVLELRELCKRLGVKGYSKMSKVEIIDAIKGNMVPMAPVAPVEPAAPVQVRTIELKQEEAKAPKAWEDSFINELKNVCVSLEGLPNTNFLPEDLLRTITQVKEATTVEELAGLSEDALVGFIHQIKQQLPRYQRDVYEAITLIARATPIHVDVDFV